MCSKCGSKEVSVDICSNELICNNPRCRYTGKERSSVNAQEFKQEMLDKERETFDELIQNGNSLNFPDVGIQSRPNL
jgi:transcription initiation factor TFIIIB Brf1 subunit/transcription initiation factor TFIIB